MRLVKLSSYFPTFLSYSNKEESLRQIWPSDISFTRQNLIYPLMWERKKLTIRWKKWTILKKGCSFDHRLRQHHLSLMLHSKKNICKTVAILNFCQKKTMRTSDQLMAKVFLILYNSYQKGKFITINCIVKSKSAYVVLFSFTSSRSIL